ncbi:type 2 lanthipeptide synthetase LanM family protein [Priestia filamentosa]|uniref:type 2 lanthipeptide synthetase LanM family protein n=1 Tax=Priestia filamentosa TaxID=1402861 RepID=UPI00397B3BE1
MKELRQDIWSTFKKAAYFKEIKTNSNSESINYNEEVLEDWMKRTGFTEEVLLNQLGDIEYTRKEFQSIIYSKKLNEVPSTVSLEWIDTLKNIFRAEKSINPSKKTAFECLLEPFIIYALNKIHTYFSSHPYLEQIIDKDSVCNSILRNLKNQLTPITVKPIVLEVNIAELRKELQGETPEEKFKFFIINRLSASNKILEFLSDYPVLARRLTEITEISLKNQLEVIENFHSDYEELNNKFKILNSPLSNIMTGAGDTHNGGKTVTILTFSNENKIIYKPRSLLIDSLFQDFLKWCNSNNKQHDFPLLQMISKENHGWQEFITYKECEDKEQVHRFYYRLGGYIAILYAFNAVDFHFENLIAHGEFPYLIDLESILYPLQPMKEQHTAQHQAMKLLMNSVLGTGILPIQYKANNELDLEVSGIGGNGGQPIGNTEVLNKNNTSEISITNNTVYLTEKENRPMINGESINPIYYISNIIRGFNDLYQLFLKEKEKLSQEEGILSPFLKVTIRYVAKNTHVYGEFLRRSEHTDYLQHGLERQRLFDILWNYSQVSNKHLAIISSEIDDLLQGDIPYFSTRVNSRSIWNSKGKEIRDFLEVSGWDLVKKKINSLSLDDMNLQKKWIVSSISTLADTREAFIDKIELPVFLKDQEGPTSIAVKIGEKLASEAIWGKGKEDVTWIGVGMNEKEKVSLSPLSIGLYDGLTGLSLLFRYLTKVTNRDDFREISEASLQSIINQVTYPNSSLSLSGYHGYSSVLYGMIQMNEIQPSSRSEDDVQPFLLNKIEPLITEDQVYDVIGGAAGALMVLLKYFEHSKSKKALELAMKCGDHIIENAKVLDKGLGWKSSLSKKILGGFSHGGTGIALSLYRLFKITNKKTYLDVCLRSLHYQDQLFDSQSNNWISEKGNKNVHRNFGWCHGSSGIIAAYTEMWDILNSNQKYMVRKSIENTLHHVRYDNHSLCHGLLGNYWALTNIKKINNSTYTKLQDIKEHILEELTTKPIISGFPGGIETPNLMLGLSGIALSLLAMEHEVSNVLILE